MLLDVLRWIVSRKYPLRVLSPLFGIYNPFLPDNRSDPYPMYRRLQTEAPVYFSRALQAWVLSRYDDVAFALKDNHFVADRVHAIPDALNPVAGAPPDVRNFFERNLLMLDPPDHTRLRRLVTKAFTPRRVESLRGRITELVDDLLDAGEKGDRFDWVEHFAVPLPVTVIAELLGVPTADRERFKRWSDALALLLDPISAGKSVKEAHRAAGELVAYLRTIIHERRARPRDDLISDLVAVQDEGRRLDESELYALLILLLVAGHETTTGLLGNALVALVRHPEARRRLAANPGQVRGAVEELIRYDSPVQATDRLVVREIQLGDKTLGQGDFCLLLLGAANRDPARFTEPDRLDLDRTDTHHLGFGHGAHYCLGAALARLETEIALQRLLDRYPGFAAWPDSGAWRRSVILRGPRRLPMKLRGAAG